MVIKILHCAARVPAGYPQAHIYTEGSSGTLFQALKALKTAPLSVQGSSFAQKGAN